MTETKVCNVCFEKKNIDDFYFRKDRQEFANKCKRCQIEGKVIQRSTTHKKCKHCGAEKPFFEFNVAGGGKWFQPYCKPCDTIRKKKHTEANIDKIKIKRQQNYAAKKEVIKERSKNRYRSNMEEIKKYSKAYSIKNKDRLQKQGREYSIKNRQRTTAKQREKRAANPEFFKEKGKLLRQGKTKEQKDRQAEVVKQWRINNSEKLKQYRIDNADALREKKRLAARKKSTDIQFRILKRLRGRVYMALGRIKKSDTTVNLLGCSLSEFKEYFTSLFTEGMTWEAYMSGFIHIDHKKPCCLFDLTKEDEQRKCFHFSNLQPLWGIDNLKKGIYYSE